MSLTQQDLASTILKQVVEVITKQQAFLHQQGQSTAFVDYILQGISDAQGQLNIDAVIEEGNRFIARYGTLVYDPQTKLYRLSVDPAPAGVSAQAQHFKNFVRTVDERSRRAFAYPSRFPLPPSLLQQDNDDSDGSNGGGGGGGGGVGGTGSSDGVRSRSRR